MTKKIKAPAILGLKISSPQTYISPEGNKSKINPVIGWAVVKDWFLGFPEFPIRIPDAKYNIAKKAHGIFVLDHTEDPLVSVKIIEIESMQEAILWRDKISSDVSVVCGATLDGKYFGYSDVLKYLEKDSLNQEILNNLARRVRLAIDYYAANEKRTQ